MQNESYFFKNQLLIAMPSLDDDTFSHSLVYVDNHTSEGAIGIIINKPIELTVERLLHHLDIESTENDNLNYPVYMGGPVSQDQGFVLDLSVNEKDLQIVASREILSRIGKGTGPNQYIIALGYCEWDAGQLEQEVLDNCWLVAPYSPELILNSPPAERWKLAAKSIGVNIHRVSGISGHA